MTTFTRLRAIAMTSFSLLALAACGSDDPTAPVTPANGTLAITVSGLPAGVNATIAVTGPSSYSQSPTASATYSVAPGTYTVAASQVTSNNVRYNAAITGSPATVTSNATATATVT